MSSDQIESSSDRNPSRRGAPRSLLGSGAIVGALTLCSRVAGLIRDVVIAAVFGAGGAADAFVLAFRIPNLFRRLFAEGAFSAGFVPVLSEYRVQRREAEVRDLIAHVSGALGLVLLVLTVAGVAAAPWLVRLVASGLDPESERFLLAVDLLRLTFPYLLLISLVALAAGVQNNYGRFAVPAFAPVLLNACLITAVLFADYADPAVMALGWGVLAAGVAQLLLQLPALRALKMLTWPRLNFRHAGMRRVLLLMAPAMLGAATLQLNLLVGTWLASFLVDGSYSWLYFADRLMEMPVGLVAVALATVVLPSLSASFADGSRLDFAATLDWGVRVAVLLALPASLALGILALPLIATIFQHGALTAEDARQASAALLAFAAGVPGLVLVKVLAPGYFGRQDTRTPVRVSVVSVVVNLVLSLALIGPFAHVGLAAATAAAGTVNALLLASGLLRAGVWTPGNAWWRVGRGIVLANAFLLCWMYWTAPPAHWWLEAAATARIGAMAGIVIGGVGIYLAIAWTAGLRLSDLRPETPVTPSA